jgi:hypothetical protein
MEAERNYAIDTLCMELWKVRRSMRDLRAAECKAGDQVPASFIMPELERQEKEIEQAIETLSKPNQL